MRTNADSNLDLQVTRGFGREWSTFRQDSDHLSQQQRQAIFEDYFRIFPWHLLPSGGGVGLDVGCGTGRWSMLVAPRVQHLHLLDPSAEALNVARENLRGMNNVSYHLASVATIPLPPKSLDFAFSLGVLHHVPDTRRRSRRSQRNLSSTRHFWSICTMRSTIGRSGIACSGG
jgi:SAM-dependent methyltransferase